MSLDYAFDVGYGYVIRPEDIDVIAAVSKDFEEDDLPILDFGLQDEKFSKEFPNLRYGTSGNDGTDTNLVIMTAGSHLNLEMKYSGKVGAFELRERDLINEELAELITFARKYRIVGAPSWVAYTSIN